MFETTNQFSYSGAIFQFEKIANHLRGWIFPKFRNETFERKKKLFETTI